MLICRSCLAALALLSCAIPRALGAPHSGAAGASRHRRLAQASSLTLTATITPAGKTPAVFGINVGHRHPSSNWQVWMRRQGVQASRAFLSSLWGSSLQTWVGGSSAWGKNLNGTLVNSSQADFELAVAQLRTPAGHDPAQASKFKNPVKWSAFDSKWSTTITASKADEQEGNHNATLAALLAINPQPPLVVIGCGAGSVRDSSIMDTTQPAYWQSRWELYRHFYAFSRWVGFLWN